jgi:hypothetical protein
MNDNRSRPFWFSRTAQTIAGGVLVALAALVVSSIGSAQSTKNETSFNAIQSPATPTDITPPEGNSAFLVGHAFGTQGYTCLPSATGVPSWTVNPARPEATLFTNVFGQPFQIITHFLSPDANPNPVTAPNPLPPGGNATWQSSLDSSRVWAVAIGKPVIAGTDSSCPNSGAIPCLLLQSIGNQQGPTGGRLLAKTTFVQRLNTNGGAAPTSVCTVGQTQLMPYTADYYFFHEDQ